MGKSKKSKNKKKKNSSTEEKAYPSVVGPDLFLLLQGRLFDDGTNVDDQGRSTGGGGKNVSLILCGEAHNDAVDVTRRMPPGIFEPKEGWIPVVDSFQTDESNDIFTALPRVLFVPSRNPVNQSENQTQTTDQSETPLLPTIDSLAVRYLHPVNGRKNKPVTLERAKELASSFVEKYAIEEDMFGRNLYFLWICTTGDSCRTQKGEGFLLEIETEAVIDEIDHGVDEYDSNGFNNDADDYDDWVFFTSSPLQYDTPIQQRNRWNLPELVAHWMEDVMMVVDDDEYTAATVDDVIDDDSDDGINENNSEGNPIEGEISVIENENRSPPLMQRTMGRYVLFEYGDLDLVAHYLTKRRLGMTNTAVDTTEYDDIIETRKRLLKEEKDVWTFDDWFDYVKLGAAKTGEAARTQEDQPMALDSDSNAPNNNHAVHLVLEAPVPPSEVELHRPRLSKDENSGDQSSASVPATNDAEDFCLHPAAEYVRCLPEDSVEAWEDQYDPSNDGIGSYLDFVYRKMMVATMTDDTNVQKNQEVGKMTIEDGGDGNDGQPDNRPSSDQKSHGNEIIGNNNGWLHCIDPRDLGCEAAGYAEPMKELWYKLLSQEEEDLRYNLEDVPKNACPINEQGDAMRFLPPSKLNPEQIELEKLKVDGILLQEEDGDIAARESERKLLHDEENLDFTFPSFELFFGLNTDIMYYSPHVKLAYSPFLAHCVKSLDNWKVFFTALFFGGTIPEALSKLNLREVKSLESVHTRSPILQLWDPQLGSYVFKERIETENNISLSFFPFGVHLCAKGSSPPRTWSSQLFADLYDCNQNQIDKHLHHPNSQRGVALAIKNWILDSIHRAMDDPKGSDDQECGGELFAAYLRAAHREIYDDIDTSDETVLLQKRFMKSLSGGRLKKHNIGKIRIPTCEVAFREILARFGEREQLPPTENVVTPRVEVLAKILIDIWMMHLFDFSLLLKIANICANETKDNVVVVCYVGSAHAKATSDFFCERLGFRRKAMVGKFEWEEDEIQTLNLPRNLWKLSELFR